MEFLKRLGVTVPPGVRVEPPTAAEATARLTELNQLRLDVEARLLEAAAGPSPRFSTRSVLPVDATGTGPGITAAIGAYISARAGTTIDPDEFRLFVALAHAFADGASALPPAVAWVRRHSSQLAAADESAGVLLLHVCTAGARALLFPDTVPADVNSTSLLRVFFAGLPAAPAGGSPVSLVEWARRYAATSAETRRGFVQSSVAPISTLFREAGSLPIAADVLIQAWPSPVPLLELDGRSAVEAACARLEAASDPTETVSALRHLVLLVRHHSVADNRSPLRAARDQSLPAVFSAGAELAAAPTASFRRSAVVSAVRDTVVPTLTSVHSFDAEPDESSVPAPFALFLPRILRLDSRSELAYERCCSAISAAESGEPVDLAAVPVGSLGLICHLLDAAPASTTAGLRRRFRLGSTNPSARLVEAIGEARGARVRVVPSPVYGAIATVISQVGLEPVVSTIVDQYLGELSGVVVDFTQASERARTVWTARTSTDPPVDERPIPTAGGTEVPVDETIVAAFNRTIPEFVNSAGFQDFAGLVLAGIVVFLFGWATRSYQTAGLNVLIAGCIMLANVFVLYCALSFSASPFPENSLIGVYGRKKDNGDWAEFIKSYSADDTKYLLDLFVQGLTLFVLSIPRLDGYPRLLKLSVLVMGGGAVQIFKRDPTIDSVASMLASAISNNLGTPRMSTDTTRMLVQYGGNKFRSLSMMAGGIYAATFVLALGAPPAAFFVAVGSGFAALGLDHAADILGNTVSASDAVNSFFATQALQNMTAFLEHAWVPFMLVAGVQAVRTLRAKNSSIAITLEAFRKGLRDVRALLLINKLELASFLQQAYQVRDMSAFYDINRNQSIPINLGQLVPANFTYTVDIGTDVRPTFTGNGTDSTARALMRGVLDKNWTPLGMVSTALIGLVLFRLLYLKLIEPKHSFDNTAVVAKVRNAMRQKILEPARNMKENFVDFLRPTLATALENQKLKWESVQPLANKKLTKFVLNTINSIANEVMDTVNFDGLKTTLDNYRQIALDEVEVRDGFLKSQVAAAQNSSKVYFQLNVSNNIVIELFGVLLKKIQAHVKSNAKALGSFDVKTALAEVKAGDLEMYTVATLADTLSGNFSKISNRFRDPKNAVETISTRIDFTYENASLAGGLNDQRNNSKKAWWYAGSSTNPAIEPSDVAFRALLPIADVLPVIASIGIKLQTNPGSLTAADIAIMGSIVVDAATTIAG